MIYLLLFLQYYPAGISNDNLILWFDAMNYTSYPLYGNIWYDLSGNNNHGTIDPTVKYYNGSFYFPGTGEIQIPPLFSSYPFTVSILLTHNENWIATTPANFIMNMGINSVRQALCVWSERIWMNYGTSNHWYIAEKPNFKGKYDWNNIIWRVYGVNSHSIHLNEIIGTNINDGGIAGGSAGWSIGGNSISNNWDEYLRGNISEIIIYNRILTISETKILNSYVNLKKKKYLNKNLYNINQSNGYIFQLIGIGRHSLSDYLLESKFSSGSLFLSSSINDNYFLNFTNNYFLISHNNQTFEFKNQILNRKWYFTKTVDSINNNGLLNLIFLNIKNHYYYNLIYSNNSNFNQFIIITSNISINNSLIFNINSLYLNSGFYTLLISFETIIQKKNSFLHILLLLYTYL